MANANRPTGLSPVRNGNGSYEGQVNIYAIAASYGTAVAVGDVVKFAGTPGSSPDGYPNVEIAATDATIVGVVVGVGRSPTVLANWANLDSTVRPASDPAVWYVAVADSPHTVFEAQVNTAATTHMGANADLVSGSNNGYVSGQTLTSTATKNDFKILGLVNRPDNAFGAYAKVLVQPLKHALA